MPLSQDVIHIFNSYLNYYIKNNPNSSKQALANEYRMKITTAALTNATDREWLSILLQLGASADESQLNGNLCSAFTEVLYMIIHRMRREIPAETIQEAITEELNVLATLQLNYIQAKKLNEAEESIAQLKRQIDTAIRRLAYLGHTKPLLMLDVSEIQALYPGMPKKTLPSLSYYFTSRTEYIKQYEYSATASNYSCDNILIYLPLVLQEEYENIYLHKRNLSSEETKKTPVTQTRSQRSYLSDTKEVKYSISIQESKEQKGEAISVEKILECTQLLGKYTKQKIYGFDIGDKIKRCNELINKLQNAAASHNKTAQEWLTILIDIGKEADDIQKGTTACSSCTEIFYLILHILRQEIKKNAPEAFALRIQHEKQYLNFLRENATNAKIGNANIDSIKQIEEEINLSIQRLAYLGYLDPLLALSPEKLEKLYYGYVSSVTGYFSNSSIVGYEFSRNRRPYGLEDTIYFSLPLVLQPEFPQIYLNKYKHKLEEIANAEKAEKQALDAINDLTLQIEALNKSPLSLKLMGAHSHDAKTLLTVDHINESDLDLCKQEIKKIDDKFKFTQDLIAKVVAAKQADFTNNVALQIDKVNPLRMIMTNIRNILLEDKRLRAKEEKALLAVNDIALKITDLEAKLAPLINKSSLELTEAKISFDYTKSTEREIEALEQQTLQLKAQISDAASAIALLTQQMDKLKQVKNNLILIESCIDTFVLSPIPPKASSDPEEQKDADAALPLLETPRGIKSLWHKSKRNGESKSDKKVPPKKALTFT